MDCTNASLTATSVVESHRRRAGLSRRELADRASVSLRAIYTYEREGVRPSRSVAILLAAVLGCKPAELRGPDG